uniref:Uncharacterized protein n=1 Tax=Globodera rostochiensis TaxID=31243 RepID=A0A914I0R0_GLORO
MLCFAYAISILIILFSLTIANESVKLVDDYQFLAFVKNPSNFGQFCKELEEKNKLMIISYGENYGLTFDETIEYLKDKSEAYLGVLFLMRQKWQCDKIEKQIKEELARIECHKFRKYLDILHEYLFRVYVEGVDQMLAQQFPAVKPQFKLQLGEKIDDGTLFDVIQSLSNISASFFGLNSDYNLKRLFEADYEPKLLKEEEYESNDANSNALIRQQFDRKLKQMLKATKKRARTAERHDEIRKYNDKFGIFCHSPFKFSIILHDDFDLLLAFFLEKKKLCIKKQKENEIKKYLESKDVYNRKSLKVKFNPRNDLIQIVPEIIEEIEQMLQKSDWIYANLTYIKMDEWILMQYALHKIGNDQKWEEIEKLLIEWKRAYNNWYKDCRFNHKEVKKPNFEEIMGNLIKILRGLVMQQIVPEIVAEIKQMLENHNWDYIHLKYTKKVEWNLLENALHKIGNDQKWKEIEQLRGEWEKAYNKKNMEKIEEVMQNLIVILRDIICKGWLDPQPFGG